MNPYEVENVADTLNRALEMPLDERQLRMNQLKKREKKMDVDSWVQTFLQTMGAIYNDTVIILYKGTGEIMSDSRLEWLQAH